MNDQAKKHKDCWNEAILALDRVERTYLAGVQRVKAEDVKGYLLFRSSAQQVLDQTVARLPELHVTEFERSFLSMQLAAIAQWMSDSHHRLSTILTELDN